MAKKNRLSRGGHSIREAAEITGLSTATITRWTSEPREVFLARANEKREQVLKLRMEGMSMANIARELGCSVGTVHRYVAEAKKAGKLPPEIANRRPGRPRKTA